MSVWAGIDLGSSSIKVVLFDDAETQLAAAQRSIRVSRPHPGWSEQHPNLWWQEVEACLDELAANHGDSIERLAGIGLSGQMLGAVLLDGEMLPVRPCILWNDQRAIKECRDLLDRVPDIGSRTNGAPDPGIVAPKLLWLAEHEPEVIRAARMLMLPKDYIRWKLTGETASEPTDAGGTMLMDCETGSWDEELCRAAGWDTNRLPPVTRAWAAAGYLRSDLAARWKIPKAVPVAAGAGDNMACTVGAGAANPGDVVISIGTSAVVNAVDGVFRPAPEKAILTSPHAAPDTYLSMGVVMSATASLDWMARLTGVEPGVLAGEAEAFSRSGGIEKAPLMRPSLSGIRTPHNQPDTGGVIDGLQQTTDRAALGYAVMEGVAFQIAECVQAQRETGITYRRLRLVGGGARSTLWAKLVATLINLPLDLPEGAPLSANMGAARLGRVAAGADEPDILGTSPPVAATVVPDERMQEFLENRYAAYGTLPRNSSINKKKGGSDVPRH